MFAYPQYTPQPTFATPAQYPPMMPTQPAAQPNPYLAQMQAMQAQMMAMQQAMAGMQASVAAPPAAAKKTRKPRTPKDPNAPKQPIPEGTSAWISYVQLIRGEIDARMKSVDPTYKGVSWKDAMVEAKRLKDLGDPRYQYTAKPKATPAPKQAIPQLPLPTAATPSITSLPFPIAGGASAPLNPPVQVATKKLVRKPAAAPAPIAAPAPAPVADLFSFPTVPVAPAMPQAPMFDVFAMAPMQQAIAETTEDLVLEEETINGIAYLMSPKKECWLMESDGTQGAWAGVYNGTSIDDSIPEPEY